MIPIIARLSQVLSETKELFLLTKQAAIQIINIYQLLIQNILPKNADSRTSVEPLLKFLTGLNEPQRETSYSGNPDGRNTS